MMELIRQWLLGITCAAMVLAVAEGVAPEGGPKRVCRLVGGLVLVLAALGPVVKLDDGALARALTEYRISAEDYGDALVEKNNLLYKTIIEENTAAYILDKAEEMGITCQAEVEFAYDDGGTPYPWSVTLTGRWDGGQEQQLRAMLETELGIPPRRQQFERIRP